MNKYEIYYILKVTCPSLVQYPQSNVSTFNNHPKTHAFLFNYSTFFYNTWSGQPIQGSFGLSGHGMIGLALKSVS